MADVFSQSRHYLSSLLRKKQDTFAVKKPVALFATV